MTSGVACPRSSKPSPCRRTPAAAILVCFSSVSVRQKMSIARRHPRTAVDRGVNGYLFPDSAIVTNTRDARSGQKVRGKNDKKMVST
jgi:hypothetical protein